MINKQKNKRIYNNNNYEKNKQHITNFKKE